MKNFILFSSLVAVLFIFSCADSGKKENGGDVADSTKATIAQTKYVCPMDTDVVSDHPGNCPKCGMELEKVN